MGWRGGREAILRRLSFMYFIVDKIIFLLSARLGDHIDTDAIGFLRFPLTSEKRT